MNAKKNLKILIILLLSAVIVALFSFLTNECIFTCQANHCLGYSVALALGVFMTDLFFVLFAMLFWLVSPIGILFILGIKLFFGDNASVVRKNFAMLLQFLSFLSWSSLMFILLVVYIDSAFYGVLNLGGDILSLAIKSGLGFFVFMIMFAMAEKKMVCFSQANKNKKTNSKKNCCENEDSCKTEKNNSEKRKENEEKEESIKIAGIEFGGIKKKVKTKIKEELKEIIDEKINKL